MGIFNSIFLFHNLFQCFDLAFQIFEKAVPDFLSCPANKGTF